MRHRQPDYPCYLSGPGYPMQPVQLVQLSARRLAPCAFRSGLQRAIREVGPAARPKYPGDQPRLTHAQSNQLSILSRGSIQQLKGWKCIADAVCLGYDLMYTRRKPAQPLVDGRQVSRCLSEIVIRDDQAIQVRLELQCPFVVGGFYITVLCKTPCALHHQSQSNLMIHRLLTAFVNRSAGNDRGQGFVG